MNLTKERSPALDLDELISQIALPATGSFPAGLPEGQRSAEQASGSVRIETSHTGHVVNFREAMGRNRGDVAPPQDVNLLPPGGTLHIPAGSRVRALVPGKEDHHDKHWREFDFPLEGGYLRGPIAWGWAYGENFQGDKCLEEGREIREFFANSFGVISGLATFGGAITFLVKAVEWPEFLEFVLGMASVMPAIFAGVISAALMAFWWEERTRKKARPLQKKYSEAIRLPSDLVRRCADLAVDQDEAEASGNPASGIDREIGSALISFSHAYQELNRRTQSDPDRYRGLELGKLHHAARTISSLSRSFVEGRGRDNVEIRSSLVRLITEATRQVWAATEGHRKDDTQDMALSIRALAAQLGCDLEDERAAA